MQLLFDPWGARRAGIGKDRRDRYVASVDIETQTVPVFGRHAPTIEMRNVFVKSQAEIGPLLFDVLDKSIMGL
ncbi:hypothetical protein BjapCC829_07800 [Bradyrhizobium barranii]|uniref:Uncharacterized protein n=1 Tax=Bradyrhizobium barranii TaxID=2992140 RepID=A0ABY3QRB7_9BRAD|nr:hypothetical protein [Bradyrhizobium japonicum]UFW88417.1 hypothetical protein BjapCC829_07800 [Bradyrhizobium japonicum]